MLASKTKTASSQLLLSRRCMNSAIKIGQTSSHLQQKSNNVSKGRCMMSSSNGAGSSTSTGVSGGGGKKKAPMTKEEREEAIHQANMAMKGYVETRILAKQGKLKSKSRGRSKESESADKIQMALLASLGAAFIVSPILGKKIAQDEEFRKKYVPEWYDFRVKAPESAWTRKELHEQLVEVERDVRERAIRGEFEPEKLEKLKQGMLPRSDLTDEDLYYAEKYGWGKIHPGLDDDDDDDDE